MNKCIKDGGNERERENGFCWLLEGKEENAMNCGRGAKSKERKREREREREQKMTSVTRWEKEGKSSRDGKPH